jgi:PST family polysaccharide transporter
MVISLTAPLRTLFRSKLGENILSLYLLQGFTYLLPLITVPYLVRVLGVEKFGIMAFASSIIIFFNILVDYGFNLSATRAIAVASANQDASKISEIFNAVMSIKLVLAIAGFGFLALLLVFVSAMQQEAALYLCLYLMVVGNAIFPVWFFQGIGKMRYITVVNVIARLIVMLGILLFVKDTTDYVVAAALQSGGFILAGIVSWFFIRKVACIDLHLPSIVEVQVALQDGWHIFLSTVAISFYANSATFILGIMVSPVMLGYFAAAEKIIKMVDELIHPISQSVYPYIAGMKERSNALTLQFIKKLILVQGGITFFISLVLLLGADVIVRLIFGSEFVASVLIVRIMAFIPFAIGLSNIFGIQVMLNFGLKTEFSKVVIASGLLNILLMMPLSYYHGAVGAASSILLAECFVTISMFLILVKKKIIKWRVYE